nr:energy transducer TonB [Acinetobacter sp. Marseille-Q1620]
MSFMDLENHPPKRIAMVGAVVFLHILIAYFFISGLSSTKVKKPAEQIIEMQITQDIPEPQLTKPNPESAEPVKIVEKVEKTEAEKPKTPIKEKVKEPEAQQPIEKKENDSEPIVNQKTQITSAPIQSPSPIKQTNSAPNAQDSVPSKAKTSGISQGVSEGAAGCAKPEYPKQALENEEQGTVRIAVLVGTDGRVLQAKVKKSSGSRTLDKAASKAYSLCVFKPAIKDGTAQESWFEIEYPFVITD